MVGAVGAMAAEEAAEGVGDEEVEAVVVVDVGVGMVVGEEQGCMMQADTRCLQTAPATALSIKCLPSATSGLPSLAFQLLVLQAATVCPCLAQVPNFSFKQLLMPIDYVF